MRRAAPGLVGGDATDLPNHADPRGQALGCLRVGVTLLGVVGQSGGHQVPGHDVGQVVRQAVQLGTGLGFELLGRDGVWKLRPGLAGRPGRCLVSRGPGPSAAGPLSVSAPGASAGPLPATAPATLAAPRAVTAPATVAVTGTVTTAGAVTAPGMVAAAGTVTALGTVAAAGAVVIAGAVTVAGARRP
jgi:hypothetical protein